MMVATEAAPTGLAGPGDIWHSILRDFSAPVRLNISLNPDQIEFLMMHDSDPFNRWQAAQSYATNLLTAAARDGVGEEPVVGKEASRLAQVLGIGPSRQPERGRDRRHPLRQAKATP